jgi:hypothetical protein
MQRRMLFRLADHELRVAEAAQVRQLRYRPPDRWSVQELLWSLVETDPGMGAIVFGHQRSLHEMRMQGRRYLEDRGVPPPFKETEFAPHAPNYDELTRFNSSRTVTTLYRRGFVDHYSWRHRYNLALTAEGFAEARRLGGVRQSEIVDLDTVQRNWRKRSDFRLGRSDAEIAILHPRRKDGPPCEANKHGWPEPVVDRLYPE